MNISNYNGFNTNNYQGEDHKYGVSHGSEKSAQNNLPDLKSPPGGGNIISWGSPRGGDLSPRSGSNGLNGASNSTGNSLTGESQSDNKILAQLEKLMQMMNTLLHELMHGQAQSSSKESSPADNAIRPGANMMAASPEEDYDAGDSSEDYDAGDSSEDYDAGDSSEDYDAGDSSEDYDSGNGSEEGTVGSGNTPPPRSGSIGGTLGGINTAPDRIKSPEDAANLVQQVASQGGGTVRIQMTHEQLNNPEELAKLQSMMKTGDDNDVKIQLAFRDNANGGGGNVLTGDKLNQAANDIKNVVSRFGKHDSFVLDTFNEGGTKASQDWADMQSTLIKSARDAGYKGNIVVEDSNWGGGLTAGPESGLMKYRDQLNQANGTGNPALIGSIHEYANDSNASQRLKSEIEGLNSSGYGVQIGEVGNANWTGGSTFDERDNAVKAVKDNLTLLEETNATVLPWMDQFVDGKLQHNVGLTKDQQLV